jgi:hypothetical protein
MATAIPEINLFLDYAKPGGLEPLLASFKSRPVYTRPAVMAGDVCKLRLYFRIVGATAESDSTEETLPAGSTIVVAAKPASNLAATSLLFCASTFTEVSGISGAKCYEGEINLSTAEIVSAMALLAPTADRITARVDIEVRNAGNTSRVTYQTSVDIFRQVYSGETAPSTVTLPPSVLTAPDLSQWQLTIGNDGQLSATRIL